MGDARVRALIDYVWGSETPDGLITSMHALTLSSFAKSGSGSGWFREVCLSTRLDRLLVRVIIKWRRETFTCLPTSRTRAENYHEWLDKWHARWQERAIRCARNAARLEHCYVENIKRDHDESAVNPDLLVEEFADDDVESAALRLLARVVTTLRWRNNGWGCADPISSPKLSIGLVSPLEMLSETLLAIESGTARAHHVALRSLGLAERDLETDQRTTLDTNAKRTASSTSTSLFSSTQVVPDWVVGGSEHGGGFEMNSMPSDDYDACMAALSIGSSVSSDPFLSVRPSGPFLRLSPSVKEDNRSDAIRSFIVSTRPSWKRTVKTQRRASFDESWRYRRHLRHTAFVPMWAGSQDIEHLDSQWSHEEQQRFILDVGAPNDHWFPLSVSAEDIRVSRAPLLRPCAMADVSLFDLTQIGYSQIACHMAAASALIAVGQASVAASSDALGTRKVTGMSLESFLWVPCVAPALAFVVRNDFIEPSSVCMLFTPTIMGRAFEWLRSLGAPPESAARKILRSTGMNAFLAVAARRYSELGELQLAMRATDAACVLAGRSEDQFGFLVAHAFPRSEPALVNASKRGRQRRSSVPREMRADIRTISEQRTPVSGGKMKRGRHARTGSWDITSLFEPALSTPVMKSLSEKRHPTRGHGPQAPSELSSSSSSLSDRENDPVDSYSPPRGRAPAIDEMSVPSESSATGCERAKAISSSSNATTPTIRSRNASTASTRNLWLSQSTTPTNVDRAQRDGLRDTGVTSATAAIAATTPLSHWSARREERPQQYRSLEDRSTRLDAPSHLREILQENEARVRKLVYERGVPAEMRRRLWPVFLEIDECRASMPPNFYRRLLMAATEPPSSTSLSENEKPSVAAEETKPQDQGKRVTAAEPAEDMVRKLERVPKETLDAIDRDVTRTLCNHRLFWRGGAALGLGALRNVLRAYACWDPEISYCQGMSTIAGALYIYSGGSEERSFFMLLQLMQGKLNFREMFAPGFRQLRRAVGEFELLLQRKLPRVARHLERQGVLPIMYADKWYLTGLLYNFPFEVVCRVWDVMLCVGHTKILHRATLALMDRAEKAGRLASSVHFEELLVYLQRGFAEDELVFRSVDEFMHDAIHRFSFTRAEVRAMTIDESTGRPITRDAEASPDPNCGLLVTMARAIQTARGDTATSKTAGVSPSEVRTFTWRHSIRAWFCMCGRSAVRRTGPDSQSEKDGHLHDDCNTNHEDADVVVCAAEQPIISSR